MEIEERYEGKKFCVATIIPKIRPRSEKIESFEEFKELIRNLGGEIVEEIIQKRDKPDPGFFIGKGKAKEIAEKNNIDILAIDDILKPNQIANLREITKKEVVDREYIIIKIFAERATTREGKLQVELAELKYRLAKLFGMGKEMSQLGGMLGTRGPGETKTEELRRHIFARIRSIEKELEEIKKTRKIHRERRKKQGFLTFSLVGYTNVGKSTILRALSGEDVQIKNQLFTTLETRLGTLKGFGGGDGKILISDTVGFIRNLPHSLVSAFRSTLEEIVFSDALIFVLDISKDYEKQFSTIRSVLQEISVDEQKPRIIVFNKIDLVSKERIFQAQQKFQDAIFISALKKIGLEELK
ncbi:MAG: GTPase HflX, partial [Candidatus Calescibacterium sp.]